MITKPMLAVKCSDVTKLKFPVLATPKLDGIRCVKVNGKALSRKFLPIPNAFIRSLIEQFFPDGVDGELIVPGASFNDTSSAVMSSDGMPDFKYFVFDYVPGALDVPYRIRMHALEDMKLFGKGEFVMKRVLPVTINNVDELNAYETKCLNEGYEGVMVRDPNGPYKLGRSTENEGWLLKVKRFEDAEAKVIELVELQRNDNEATKDNVGHTKRSTHAENMTPMGVLGAIRVKDLKTGVEFSIGSGFDAAQRKAIWEHRADYVGELVKYKHQPSGAKEAGAPRFPVFIGFRHTNDMD